MNGCEISYSGDERVDSRFGLNYNATYLVERVGLEDNSTTIVNKFNFTLIEDLSEASMPENP